MQFILVLATFLAAAVANPVAQPNPDKTPEAKRDLVKRATCPANGASATPYPTGAGPVPTPNSPNDFTAYSVFAAAATNAPIVGGFKKAFINLHAAVQLPEYITFFALDSYDPAACGAKCKADSTCKAFNIYYERDPINSCPNPAATTAIKCSLYSVAISSDDATNFGQTEQSFKIVIAGSDGYNLV